MYTSERIQDGLEKWSDARAVLRGIQAIDIIHEPDKIAGLHAAINAAIELCQDMAELADDIESECYRWQEYLGNLAEQAHRNYAE